MRTVLEGEIEQQTPFVRAVLENGQLYFTAQGDMEMTVDTGFTEGVALPGEILSEMDLDLIFNENF